MWGLGVLGWGFVRGGVRVLDLSGPRTAGRAFLRSTLMFLRADRVCCGGYAASASRFGGAALLAGLSTCMMWRGRRGRAGPGLWLVFLACAIPSRRVLLFEWLLVVGSL